MKKLFQKFFKSTLYTCKQPLMMAYERFDSTWNNFGKFIRQLQPETKALIQKLERILIKSYWHNVSLLFNNIYIYIYIYIYICIYIPKLCKPAHAEFGYIYIYIYPNSAWAGWNTRSLFKWSLTGSNSEFSFS